MEDENSLDSSGDVFSVEKIIDTKLVDDKLRIYKVRWEGYGSEDDTWEPEEHLISCHNLLKDFWDKKKLAARLAKQDRKKKRSKKLARKLIDDDVVSSASASQDTSSVENSSSDEGFEKLVSEAASDKKAKLSKPKWTEINTAIEDSWLVKTEEIEHKKKKKKKHKHKHHDKTREVSKIMKNSEKQLTNKPDSGSQEVSDNKATKEENLSAIRKEKSGSESSNREPKLSLKKPVEDEGSTGFQIVSESKTSGDLNAIKEKKHNFEASTNKDKASLKTQVEVSKSDMQREKVVEVLESGGRSTGFLSATPKKVEKNLGDVVGQEASHNKTVKEEGKIISKQSSFSKDLKIKLSIGIRKENKNIPIEVLSDSSSSESSSTESEGDSKARSLMAKWRSQGLSQSPSQSQSSLGGKSLMKIKDKKLRVSYEETKGRNLMQKFKEDERMKLKSVEGKEDFSSKKDSKQGLKDSISKESKGRSSITKDEASPKKASKKRLLDSFSKESEEMHLASASPKNESKELEKDTIAKYEDGSQKVSKKHLLDSFSKGSEGMRSASASPKKEFQELEKDTILKDESSPKKSVLDSFSKGSEEIRPASGSAKKESVLDKAKVKIKNNEATPKESIETTLQSVDSGRISALSPESVIVKHGETLSGEVIKIDSGKFVDSSIARNNQKVLQEMYNPGSLCDTSKNSSYISTESDMAMRNQTSPHEMNEGISGDNFDTTGSTSFVSKEKTSVEITQSKQKVIGGTDSRNIDTARAEICTASPGQAGVKDSGTRQSNASFGDSENIAIVDCEMSAVSTGKSKQESKTNKPKESRESNFGIERSADSNLSTISPEKGRIQSKETRPKEMKASSAGMKISDVSSKKKNVKNSETKPAERRETNVGIQSSVASNICTVSIEKAKIKIKETRPKKVSERTSGNVDDADRKLTTVSSGESKVKNAGTRPKESDGTKMVGNVGIIEGMAPFVSSEKAKVTKSEAKTKQSSDRKIDNVCVASATPTVSTGNITITKHGARPKDHIVTMVDPHVVSKTSNVAELTQVTSSLVSNPHPMSVDAITDIIQQGMREHERNLAFLKEKKSTVLRNFDAHSQIAKSSSDNSSYASPVKDRKNSLKVTEKEFENPFAKVYESRAFENLSPAKEKKSSPDDKKQKDKQLDNPFAKIYENIGNVSPSKGGSHSPKAQGKEAVNSVANVCENRTLKHSSPVKGGRDATKTKQKEMENPPAEVSENRALGLSGKKLNDKKLAPESPAENTGRESLSEKNKAGSESSSENKVRVEPQSGKTATVSESPSDKNKRGSESKACSSKTGPEPSTATDKTGSVPPSGGGKTALESPLEKNKAKTESLSEMKKTASESLSEKNKTASASLSEEKKTESESLSEKNESGSESLSEKSKTASEPSSGKEKPRSESPSERRRSLIKIGKSDIVKQLAKIGSVVGSGKFARSLAQIKASSESRDSSDEDVSKTDKGKKIQESYAPGTKFEEQKKETMTKKEGEILSDTSYKRTVEAQVELAGISDKTFSKTGENKDISSDISSVAKDDSDATFVTDNFSIKQLESKCNIDGPSDNTSSAISDNSSENRFESKELADKPTEIVSNEASSSSAPMKGDATKSRVGKETIEREKSDVLVDGQAKANAKPDNILREKAKKSDKIATSKSKLTPVADNNLRLEFTKVATLKSDQSKSSLKRPMEGGSTTDNKLVKKNKLDRSKARYANKRQLSKEAFAAPKNDILGDILGRNNQMLRSIDDRMEDKQRNNESKGSDKETNENNSLYEPISDVDFDLDLEEFHDDDGLFLSDDDSGYLDHVSIDDIVPLQMSQEDYLKAFCTGVYETILGGIAAGMDPDCWDSSNGGTPLWSAIEDDRYDIAKKLLKLGSNPNYRAENGKTALMVAVEGGKFGFVSMLLRAGAHVNLQQHNGETALILACRKGHEDIINLLLNYGADTKITPASYPKPVAEYSPEYQILLFKRIIDRHTERLKTMSEMVLKQCLNVADEIVQPPVLSCRCISPDEKKLHDIYFKCEHFAGEKGTIILLLCLGAQFSPSGEIKLLLNNKDNGIEAVILNKEHQIPVYETNHSMYFLFPNVGQLNSLCLRTHKTGFKMLVSIYAVKTDKNWIDSELESFYREFQMYQLACNQEIS